MIKPGSQIGKYQIVDQIGQGGMGTVFRATDNSGGTVAIKVLNEDLASSKEFRDRLESEAKLGQKLDSPYIVKVIDRGDADGRPFLVMELIEGTELRDLTTELSFDEKFELTNKIALGIESAHQVGLIHKDLKPENILITSDGTPKIMDFGLAQEIDPDEVDDFGNVEGTLYYAAPEQLCGEPLSNRTDLFSFGVILYELFCGRRPFESDYASGIIYDILHEDPLKPSEINSDLPLWLDSIIDRLLAKQASNRFATISEYLQELEKSRLSGDGLQATPRQKAVTVIDLKNLSNDESWQYFCEGFTEDVIRELSRRTELIVSAQPSTVYSRNIEEMFEKCRSDFIVSGSLMKWQDQLKLNLSVHGVDGQEIIWSETFTESIDNLFTLLSDAAMKTSEQLALATNSKTVDISEEFRVDVTAYDFYLKGKNYYQTNKPDDLLFAEQMYQKALESDPAFGLAYAGLSDIYTFQYMAYYDRTQAKIESAKVMADKAVALLPQSPDAHRSLARFFMFTGEIDKAEETLKKTIEIDPKYALGYRTLGWLSHAREEFETATNYARRALELAPTDLETLLLLSLLAINQRQFGVAMSTLHRAIELGPDYGRAYYYLGEVYVKLGVFDLATENFNLAAKYKGDPNSLIDGGYIHLMLGNYDKALGNFEESIKADFFPFVAQYYIGLTHLIQGNNDQAVKDFMIADEMTKGFDLEAIENIDILIYRAMMLAGKGDKDSAKKILSILPDEDQLGASSLANIARCYSLMNEMDKAELVLTVSKSRPNGPTEKEIANDPHFSLHNNN